MSRYADAVSRSVFPLRSRWENGKPSSKGSAVWGMSVYWSGSRERYNTTSPVIPH
jgi:hypothetical protein